MENVDKIYVLYRGRIKRLQGNGCKGGSAKQNRIDGISYLLLNFFKGCKLTNLP